MHARSNHRSRVGTLGAALTAALLPALVASLLPSLVTAAHAGDPPKVTEIRSQRLSDVPGKEVSMILVEFPPGGADPVHRHDASAFVYVLEGSVEMQMEGGEKVTLHPGETFYEDPRGVHLVGRNTSDTKPAKLLAVLVKKEGAPSVIPVTR